MEKVEIIFESYNMTLEKNYDKLLNSIKSEEFYTRTDIYDKVMKKVKDKMKEWENTPVNKLNNVTPAEFFKEISDLNKIVNIFKLGAKICDDDMPEVFIDKLKSFGDDIVDELLKLVTDKTLLDNDDDYLIVTTAIKTLGEWKVERAVEPLIMLMHELDNDDDLFKEKIKDALVDIGMPCLEPILKEIEATENIQDSQEYLLIALSEVGAHYKSDTIYKCLKNSFLKMNSKAIGAICLGRYGDGRAIPALRGYVVKNINIIDKVTFYEIKDAIELLGGEMEDIAYPGFDDEENI